MPHYTRGMGSRAYWEERMLDRDLFARQTEDEVLRIIIANIKQHLEKSEEI